MRTDLGLSIALIILSAMLVYVVIIKAPNTKPLKDKIRTLSQSNLALSRKVQSEYAIPYSVGTEGPLKFYGTVKGPDSTSWQRVGNIFSESTTDDTVYALEQRIVPPFSDDSYEYRAFDTDKNIHIQLPAVSGRKLENDDVLTVPGKESIGNFIVARDKDYYYIRM